QGVLVAQNLFVKLFDAAKIQKKPKFTTIVIFELFSKTRRTKDPRYVKDFQGRQIEPNRNFPRPGESYDYARERGIARASTDRAELLDCLNKPLEGEDVTKRMLAETRILVQFIERVKPMRAASIHAKRPPDPARDARGKAPGIFVDPRGGFHEINDMAFSKEGQQDDDLAINMLREALSWIPRKGYLHDAIKKGLTHPYLGNVAERNTGTVPPDANYGRMPSTPPPTVHYTVTKHPPATSFGMWAPAPEQSGGRPGIPTITIEYPQAYKSATKQVNEDLTDIYVQVLVMKFLDGLS